MIGFNVGTENKVMPKYLINIGACLDIPTAALITGVKGETIYNGGLGQITGVVGPGNHYKSSIQHYMMLTAAERVLEATNTAMLTYDTEVNVSIDRLEHLAREHPGLPEYPITGNEPIWTIQDKTTIPANKWGEFISKYSDAKSTSKDKSVRCVYQPFVDPYTKKPYEGLIPTFVEVDSFTEFEPESTVEMLTKDIDTSETNTSALRQGLFKSKFLTTLPRISNQGNIYFFLLAHIGDKKDLATGPAKYAQPTRKLQYLKAGDEVKGVTGKFFFLTNNAWSITSSTELKNSGTNGPEYPSERIAISKELNLVKMTQLRSKSGTSGYTIELVVSQSYGVLPSMTEFHFIKENGRFGLSGSNLSYSLDLMPDVSLSRTTVHDKLDKDAKLRRALNITAELGQLFIYHKYLENQGLLCTPKELYDDIKALGYDWDMLLSTRGYWTINQYDHPVPYLSTVDLLRMRKGLYHPYFLDENKQLIIKKEKK